MFNASEVIKKYNSYQEKRNPDIFLNLKIRNALK